MQVLAGNQVGEICQVPIDVDKISDNPEVQSPYKGKRIILSDFIDTASGIVISPIGRLSAYGVLTFF